LASLGDRKLGFCYIQAASFIERSFFDGFFFGVFHIRSPNNK